MPPIFARDPSDDYDSGELDALERPHARTGPRCSRSDRLDRNAIFAAAAQKPTALPTPESVFGFPVAADYKLFDYDQSIDYFRKLAAATPRMKLITVGKTAYGKTWTAAIISSPGQFREKLDKLRDNMRLAHPTGLTDDDARKLARDGRVFVDISGGLHASEIAGSQHTPLVAYDLLSRANEPDMKAILDSTVFFLWPSINPDGQDIVVNCAARATRRKSRADGTLPEVCRTRQQSRCVHAQRRRVARRPAYLA